jgi:hypothetical protein
MRRLPAALALVVLVVIGVVALVTGTTASPPLAPRVQVAPVTSRTVVCPAINANPTGTSSRAVVADVAGALTPPSTSSGTVASTVLAGAKRSTSTLNLSPSTRIVGRPKLNQTVAIAAGGSVSATLAADQVTVTPVGRDRGLTDSVCDSPGTDWWFAGASGRVGFNDSLTLANPSPLAAVVTISLWGPKGLVSNPRLDAVRVNPKSALHLSVASMAPDLGLLTMHVHASSGAVTAALLDRRTSGLSSDGADYLPPTEAPTTTGVVPGFAAGNGAQAMMIGNPNAVDATVSLKLVTRSGSFTPSGDNQIVVPAGHTVDVNLDRGFSGATGAAVFSSDHPVVAEGASVTPDRPQRPDLMWLAATPPLTGSAAVADGREPDGGRCLLLLSAPAGAARATVTTPGGHTTTVSVPAGRSVAADVTATVKAGGGSWTFVVTPVGTAAIYGVRMLTFTGAHGALVTDVPLVGLPTALVLPAVRSDPRVATP